MHWKLYLTSIYQIACLYPTLWFKLDGSVASCFTADSSARLLQCIRCLDPLCFSWPSLSGSTSCLAQAAPSPALQAAMTLLLQTLQGIISFPLLCYSHGLALTAWSDNHSCEHCCSSPFDMRGADGVCTEQTQHSTCPCSACALIFSCGRWRWWRETTCYTGGVPSMDTYLGTPSLTVLHSHRRVFSFFPFPFYFYFF